MWLNSEQRWSRTVPTRCHFFFLWKPSPKNDNIGRGNKKKKKKRFRLDGVLRSMVGLTLTTWSSLHRFGSNFAVLSLSRTSISSTWPHRQAAALTKPVFPDGTALKTHRARCVPKVIASRLEVSLNQMLLLKIEQN